MPRTLYADPQRMQFVKPDGTLTREAFLYLQGTVGAASGADDMASLSAIGPLVPGADAMLVPTDTGTDSRLAILEAASGQSAPADGDLAMWSRIAQLEALVHQQAQAIQDLRQGYQL